MIERLTKSNTITPVLKDYTTAGEMKAKYKLKEYEDAEEQGLLLRLPCKVGDTVYTLDQECCGDEVCCEKHDCDSTCKDYHTFVIECKFGLEMVEDVGKYIFLTKSEAEAKLAELRGVNHE